jgi:hypothetical protein
MRPKKNTMADKKLDPRRCCAIFVLFLESDVVLLYVAIYFPSHRQIYIFATGSTKVTLLLLRNQSRQILCILRSQHITLLCRAAADCTAVQGPRSGVFRAELNHGFDCQIQFSRGDTASDRNSSGPTNFKNLLAFPHLSLRELHANCTRQRRRGSHPSP